jgi:hypothetical protein
MNRVPIDLAESFEKALARALSLPRTDNAWPSDTAIKRALRYLYEAANGRIVETNIGAITIAPPVEPSMKEKPFCLMSAAELLMMVKDNSSAYGGLDYNRSEPQKPRQSNMDSALFEFMAGRLGAPECWPDQRNDAYTNGAAVPCYAPTAGGKPKGKKLSARESTIYRQQHCNQPQMK